MPSHIKYDLTLEKVKEFKQTLLVLKNMTTFRVSMTKLERKRAAKIGTKYRGFLEKALELAADKPNLLPRSIDPEIFAADAANFKAMEELVVALRGLTEELVDTLTAMGADVFSDARAIYNNAKVTGKEEGVKITLSEMKAAFNKKRTKKDPTASNKPTT